MTQNDRNIFNCLACTESYYTHASLNKHIQSCIKYNEWIKTYNPIYFKCKECSLNFINKKYLNSHNCN